jgi:hypothetical protein
MTTTWADDFTATPPRWLQTVEEAYPRAAIREDRTWEGTMAARVAPGAAPDNRRTRRRARADNDAPGNDVAGNDAAGNDAPGASTDAWRAGPAGVARIRPSDRAPDAPNVGPGPVFGGDVTIPGVG